VNRPPTRLNLHEIDTRSWSRLDSILDHVLDLPVNELSPALARLCGGDRDLEEQIRSILATDLAVEGYLSRTARQGLIQGAAGLDAELPALEGRLLGPWRVLQPIARGGMGVVYLGERADGTFEQRVAIKFLGRGITTPAALARFRQERQILARLEHPHIARLVDGGVTDDGLWWFAMEYVDGSPITEWCVSRRLSARSILELFQQACGAVQVAHRNLIVHRDLKPSNIMVSSEGDVKLLDFGIAKMLEEEEGAERSFSTTAAMTPNYAAPEQIRGEPPTTATDVYALGVVLYELLTGERPHRSKTGTFEDVRRAVLEQEPEAPSARIRRQWREATHAGHDARAPGVPHELDAIVLTAVRKEPERRYPSVEALSEDVQRHLDGRPVRASGRTFGYLASKFFRRNRVPLAATLMVLLALSAGLYATARERDRARLEAARAREIKEFALGLFRVSNPEEGGRPDVSARELLDRGAARVDREIRDPRVKAEMWDMLGSVYQSLDLFPPAISMYRRAIVLRRAHPERPDTLLATSLRQLGSALNENGNYEEAERMLREALAMERRTFGAVHPRVGFATGELAILENRMGHTAQAESLYREVIRVDSLTIGMKHRNTASDLGNLGMHYYSDGRYREAVPYIARALAIREQLFGRNHVETATGMDQLGLALVGTGAVDSGLVLMREALTIRRRWLAPDHPDIAHSLLNIGSTLAANGRLPEAEHDLGEALALRRRMLDPKDPNLAHTHNELAIVFYREGVLDSAAAHFDEALRIWAYSLPSDHGDVLTTRGNLAVVYREMGRYAVSEKLLREVLAARLRFQKPDHLDVATSEYHLGRLLVMTKRPGEGIPYLHRADASRSAALDADDPRVAEVRLALGNALVAVGRREEGLTLLRQSLESAQKRLGPKDRMVVLARSRL
jgi:serine/threonine-protein kinase